MPRLNKQVIGKYLETGCKRQLYLNLLITHELTHGNYPERFVRRALAVSRRAGEEWEAEKLDDLEQALGHHRLLLGTRDPKVVYGAQGQPLHSFARTDLVGKVTPLPVPPGIDLLQQARADMFLLQPQYRAPQLFQQQHDLLRFGSSFELSELRPDLIWVRGPRTYPRYVTASGQLLDVPADDERLQLQLIDIKRISEPSREHFAEVVYYILTLAAWLTEERWEDRFLVVPNGCIWPGSVEIAQVRARAQQPEPSIEELKAALLRDLDEVPFEAVAQRVNTFFARDLVEVLTATTANWSALGWHINQSCSACDFLGVDVGPNKQRHPNHCDLEARNGQLLTLIPFLGRGAKAQLESKGVTTLEDLRHLSPQSPVFAEHHQLRAERSMLLSRAEALSQNTVIMPPGRKTTALPNPWDCTLKIFLTVDFDPSTGMSYAFGFRGLWWPPRPASSADQQGQEPHGNTAVKPKRPSNVFIVANPTPNEELKQLLGLLEVITNVITEVEEALKQNGYTGQAAVPTVQFYIWDQIQAKHLRRVMGRHINNPLVQERFQWLIWRFPPESVLPDPEWEKKSPIAVVKPVVRQLLALPLPYDYTLLKVARLYYPSPITPSWFDVDPLFESGLGDQIPYERAHEIWSRQGYRNAAQRKVIPWNTLQRTMERTVEIKLTALASIVSKLEQDLKPTRGCCSNPRKSG